MNQRMEPTDATYPAMKPRQHLAVHVEQVRRKSKADTGAQRHEVDDCQRASPFLRFGPRMGSKPEANNVCREHDSQDERFPVVGNVKPTQALWQADEDKSPPRAYRFRSEGAMGDHMASCPHPEPHISCKPIDQANCYDYSG
jgi:hypothetical protein